MPQEAPEHLLAIERRTAIAPGDDLIWPNEDQIRLVKLSCFRQIESHHLELHAEFLCG